MNRADRFTAVKRRELSIGAIEEKLLEDASEDAEEWLDTYLGIKRTDYKHELWRWWEDDGNDD